MYEHENKGTGTITIVDKNGKHHTFFPNSIITLDGIYETKGIVCLNADKKVEQEEKPTKKSFRKETKEDD